MKFLIKYPSRQRKEIFFSTLEKFINYFSDENEYFIVVSCDDDDETMNNKETIERINSYKNIKLFFGPRVSKIEAINRDIEKITKEEYDWDILIYASDDYIPQEQSYDKVIVEEMLKNFPDLDGGLWFFDGYRKDINTVSIMSRKRYDRFGYIYYPEYKTWYCDDEYTIIGLTENKLKYIDRPLIKHEYPDFNSSVSMDSLYQHNLRRELTDSDCAIFERRKSEGFK